MLTRRTEEVAYLKSTLIQAAVEVGSLGLTPVLLQEVMPARFRTLCTQAAQQVVTSLRITLIHQLTTQLSDYQTLAKQRPTSKE